MFLATAYQHRRAVEYLISKGAEENQTNAIGLSPFLMAIKRDDLPLAKLLIDNGCNVFQVCKSWIKTTENILNDSGPCNSAY